MNTLLGEIATLNDIQYARYRAAFKFRKLQKHFYLEHLNVGALQEIFNVAGIQSVEHTAEIPVSQLRTIVTEMYTTLRTLKPILGSGKLKQAQDLCFNWLQMAYECSEGGAIDSGSLKLTLCLFVGGRPSDKSRFIFHILANANGAIELEGLKYFCQATQRIGYSVQERLYSSYSSYMDIFHECLTFVRSEEDVEDEELDGGIKRQWLSQFEFVKLFSSIPEPRFLSWLALWYSLPTMESVVHSVRCSVCTRKPIVSFRYQCTECQSVNLCQMCFLKGRTTNKHEASHKVIEISTASKGHKSWRRRLLGLAARQENGRNFDEPCEPFVFTPRHALISLGTLSDHNQAGSGNSIHAISEMFNSSHSQADVNSPNGVPQATHQPTIIRIGSADTPKKHAHQPHPLERSTKKVSTPLRRTESLKVEPAFRNDGTPTRSRRDNKPTTLHPLNECTRCDSPDSVMSERKFGYNGPVTVGNVYSDLQSDKRMSLVSTSTAGSGSAASDASFNLSPYYEGQRSPMAVAKSLAPSTGRSGYENVPNSGVRNEQDELDEINRRLSMEVDQILGDLPVGEGYADYDIPRSIYGNKRNERLRLEERALENRLQQLSSKRDKLAGELHGLINEVQTLQLSRLRQGAPYTISESNMESLLSPPGSLDAVHFRGESVPSMMPGFSSTAAMKTNSLGRVNPSNSHILDPLVNFTEEELESHPSGLVGPVENYRISMQW